MSSSVFLHMNLEFLETYFLLLYIYNDLGCMVDSLLLQIVSLFVRVGGHYCYFIWIGET